MGLWGKLEALGKGKGSCKINSIPKGRDSTLVHMACKTLTGEITESLLQLWTMSTSNLSGMWL